MTELEFDPERLRPARYIHEPDPRNAPTAWVDRTFGIIRPVQANDLHDAVAAFVFSPAVPEEIVQHFETAKNVYLYPWFIYRFQPVAEMQSLACLEYALRTRLADEIKVGKLKAKRPGSRSRPFDTTVGAIADSRSRRSNPTIKFAEDGSQDPKT